MPTFPVLERVAYLNAGTFGPLAQETIDAVRAQTAVELEGGRGGKAYFDNLIDTRARVRGLFAGLLGTTPDQVALTASTTMGCQIVLSGLRLEPGDEIVTTDEEHFGLLGPLHVSGARVRVAETRGRSAEKALEAVSPRWGRGRGSLRFARVLDDRPPPPGRRDQGRDGGPLLVDGAQSIGAIPVDVGDADFYTVSGQKWLCGPDATGALYVRDLDALAIALPTYWSREAHEPDGTFAPVEAHSASTRGRSLCRHSPGSRSRCGPRRRRATTTRARSPSAAVSSSPSASTWSPRRTRGRWSRSCPKATPPTQSLASSTPASW